MLGRRILVVGGASASALVVVALVLAGAVLMLPAERIGAFAAARAEAMLERDVEVERFRIRLLPRPSVSLEGLTVAGPDSAAFASVRRIDLRPKLLPLLRRNVVIDEVVLDRPRLVVEVAADGTTNLPALAETGGADAGDGAAGDAELSIDRFQVKDGLIGYVDEANGTVVRLEGVDQELRLDGSITSGELSRVALEGILSIAGVDANLPGLAFPLRDIALRVEHRIDLDRGADRLELETLNVTVQEVALNVAGSVQALSDPATRSVTLTASTGSFDVARLIASLPPALLGDSGERPIDAAGGRASVDVAVSGRVGEGAMPVVDGTLRLDDVALAYEGSGSVVTGLKGQVAFSMDSVATDGVTGRLLGEPLEAAFNIHDFAKPRGRVELRTSLALDEAQRLGLLPEGTRGAGDVALDVTAAGPMTEPAGLRLEGSIGLAGVTLETPALDVPLRVETGRLELRGRELAGSQLSARLGESDVTLDLEAADWLPFALGDSTTVPAITFAAVSRLFDADEVLGPSDAPYSYNQLFFAQLTGADVDGLTPAQAAEAIGLGMPRLPPMRLDGRVRVAKFVHGGSAFDEVDIAVAARDGELEVRAASFRMMGGGVHLTGRLSPAAGEAREGAVHSLVLDSAVNDVTADGFLERFTTFRDRVGGSLLLAGSARMNLDRYLLPERESVGGEGNIAFLDGRLENWPLTRMLGERLGIGSLDTLAFRDWSGQFRVASSAVVLDEMLLEAGDLAVRAAGSFHLGGNLDLGATVYVPPETASRVPGAPAAFVANVAELAGDEDGRIPIGARISGTAKNPSIRLDMSEAGALAANRAREAAQAEARELAGRLIGDALG
ncbi:MAG: AsmA-like C-terminal region-containing protein, partial [Longimicrobiales bacterium]